MDAKHIADLIGQVSEHIISRHLTLDMGVELHTALWELADRKGLREDVAAIIQTAALEGMASLSGNVG